MLQLINICKTYKTGDLVQTALDNVSLNLRDNEFVAILGPSGSGKTTLLNMIGGLDRYDSGELIINGISTKKYKDRDWDSYRNHTVGFVFQNYNLIPHQSILSNVELALTISGVSKNERRKRAIESLKKVGLGNQIHKKPNQLSGGQMQRVAIARALVNNPDILLADEPTGALDTETSIQVMDLLKEVAKDRLVVMVTHNPDLAYEYATRIVRLQDGKITSDSAPYNIDNTVQPAPQHKNMGHSSMSMWTSLGLSFNNLLTKKTRTLMTAFAGSIGIIGIALILSISTGVNNYIMDIEEETLADYPVQIYNSGFDMTSMLSSRALLGDDEDDGEKKNDESIRVTELLSTMFTTITSNDLSTLMDYLESGESDIYDYVNAIEYQYEVEPQIYYEDGDSVRQVNPNNLSTVSMSGLSGSMSASSIMNMLTSAISSSNVFYKMPENPSLYESQYDVLAGHWPEDYNECVLVLTSSGSISDLMVYILGLRDYQELLDLMETYANGEEIESDAWGETFSYDDVLGITFKLVSYSDCYAYDEDYDIWVDKTEDEEYMKQIVSAGEDLTIVGVVKPSENANSSALTSGVNYPASLINHVAGIAADSDIVKYQIEHPTINVFTGEEFGEEGSGIDFESMFSVDTDALADAFDFSSMMSDAFDMDSMSDSLSESLDMDSFSLDLDMSDMDFSELMSADSFSIDMSDFDMSDLSLELDMSSMDFGDLTFDMSSMMGDTSDMTTAIQSAVSDISALISSTGNDNISSLTESLISGYESYTSENTQSEIVSSFKEFLETPEGEEALNKAGEASLTVSTDSVQELLKSIEYYLEYEAPGEDDVIVIGEEDLENISEISDLEVLLETDSKSIIYKGSIEYDEIENIIEEWLSEYIDFDPDEFASTLAEAYIKYAEDITVTSFSEYMNSDDAESVISDWISSTYGGSFNMQLMNIESSLVTSVSGSMSGMTDAMTEMIQEQMTEMMTSMTDEIQEQMSTAIESMMESMMESITSAIEEQMTEMMDTMMETIEEQITDAMSGMMDQIVDAITDSMSDMMDEMTESMQESMEDMFTFDEDSLSDIFDVDMDSDSLTEILMSLSTSGTASLDSNLSTLGYVDFNTPSEIDIYPTDFDTKENVIAILDGYNDMMNSTGREEQVITYMDTVGTLMSSVTTIIDVISYVLVAFVSVSLIVSSIMIGIITYISVLERTREIGILRAIGASRSNISRIFNAETFIIGLCAGLLGVIVSRLLLIPINYAVHNLTGTTTVNAVLPLSNAVVLVILSMVLTIIGGLIPSRSAAKKEMVDALRTE